MLRVCSWVLQLIRKFIFKINNQNSTWGAGHYCRDLLWFPGAHSHFSSWHLLEIFNFCALKREFSPHKIIFYPCVFAWFLAFLSLAQWLSHFLLTKTILHTLTLRKETFTLAQFQSIIGGLQDRTALMVGIEEESCAWHSIQGAERLGEVSEGRKTLLHPAPRSPTSSHQTPPPTVSHLWAPTIQSPTQCSSYESRGLWGTFTYKH